MKTVTIAKSNIKEYHFFEVRPHPDIPLKVEMEEDNIRDPNALAIKMPSIDHIHQLLHKKITWVRKQDTKKTACL